MEGFMLLVAIGIPVQLMIVQEGGCSSATVMMNVVSLSNIKEAKVSAVRLNVK